MPPKGAGTTTSAKRLARELGDLKKPDALPEGCVCGPTDPDTSLYEWSAVIDGPQGSPYENDHCNINAQGGICLDILKGSWSPALSIVKVLLSISSLLADPNPHDPLVPDIAQKFLKDRVGHDKLAKEWTQKYAQTTKKADGSALPSKAAVEVITIEDD